MPGFARSGGGRVIGEFSVAEAALLRNLIAQVVELVQESGPEVSRDVDPLEAMLNLGGSSAEPDDPVLARLLPSAYADDEEAAGEFRRFTERNLRDEKAANGMAVIADMENAGLSAEAADQQESLEFEVGPDRVGAWLRCLTDVRLALATRLGIEEGDEAYWMSLPDTDPRRYVHDVYDWLGYVQETLVQSLS